MKEFDLLDDELLTLYGKHGYLTVKAMFPSNIVDGVRREISQIVQRYPNVPEELIQFVPPRFGKSANRNRLNSTSASCFGWQGTMNSFDSWPFCPVSFKLPEASWVRT